MGAKTSISLERRPLATIVTGEQLFCFPVWALPRFSERPGPAGFGHETSARLHGLINRSSRARPDRRYVLAI